MATVSPRSGLEDVVNQPKEHYLKEELYELVREDTSIFEFLQSGSLDGIWYWDIENPEEEWLSPRFKELFGYTDEEIPNTSAWWQENIFPEDLPIALDNFQKHVADPSHPYDQVVRYRHKDGSTVWVRCRGMAIRDERGKPLRLLGAHSDLTALMQTEEALREAKEAAEHANRAKAAFLANMSHEIRTPMNGILGMTELVLATNLTQDQREYITLISQSADSLLNLINDILDFSKIEAGKLKLEKREFELRDAIGDTLQTLGFRAAEKGLELAYQVQSNVPDCLIGDLGRLRQVLVNLVGNALKFTERGEVVVEVQLDSQTDDHATLNFHVADTGIGIPPGDQGRIFESFVQAENSTTRCYGGTGLGLAISSQLVALMEGRIWVESEVGVGSCFHFTARFLLGSEKPGTARTTPEALDGLRVLVVDDNETNRKILRELLRNWEMIPALASGGAEALEMLQANAKGGEPFQLVVLDLVMPGMDGGEVARRIRDEFGEQAPPILLLSSAGQPAGGEGFSEIGIACALTKPVKQSDLLGAITRTFDAGRNEQALAVPRVEPRPLRVAPMKILLAEDGRVNQIVAMKLLEERGHTVVLASNGRQALGALGREDFDAVLMDIQMPELNGYEATGTIRKHEEGTGRHLPIIAMTANALEGDRAKCLEAGMDDYVPKPVRSRELFAVLEKYAPESDRPLAQGGERPAAAAHQRSAGDPEEGRPADEVFDARGFENQAESNELMCQLIDIFDEDSGKLLERIEGAAQAGDSEALQQAVHALKGMIGNYSARQAFNAAARLDSCARVGDLAQARAELSNLRNSIQRLREALHEFRRRIAG